MYYIKSHRWSLIHFVGLSVVFVSKLNSLQEGHSMEMSDAMHHPEVKFRFTQTPTDSLHKGCHNIKIWVVDTNTSEIIPSIPQQIIQLFKKVINTVNMVYLLCIGLFRCTRAVANGHRFEIDLVYIACIYQGCHKISFSSHGYCGQQICGVVLSRYLVECVDF